MREIRTARGLTLQQLSNRLAELGRPILLSALSKIEKGQRRVDTDDLVAIALALEVSPNHLLLSDDAESESEVRLTHGFSTHAQAAWEWALHGGMPHSTDAKAVEEDFVQRMRAQVVAL